MNPERSSVGFCEWVSTYLPNPKKNKKKKMKKKKNAIGWWKRWKGHFQRWQIPWVVWNYIIIRDEGKRIMIRTIDYMQWDNLRACGMLQLIHVECYNWSKLWAPGLQRRSHENDIRWTHVSIQFYLRIWTHKFFSLF